MATSIKVADLMVGFLVDPKDWRRVNDRIKRLAEKEIIMKVGIDSTKAKKDADRFFKDVNKGIDTSTRKRSAASNQATREMNQEMNMWRKSRQMVQNIENANAMNNRKNLQLNARLEQQNMQNMQKNLRFNATLQRQVAAAQRAAAREAAAALVQQTAQARQLSAQINTISLAWKNGSVNAMKSTASLAAMTPQIRTQLAAVNKQVEAYSRMGVLTAQQQAHQAQLIRQAQVYNQALNQVARTQAAIAKSQAPAGAGGMSGSNMGMFLNGANAMGAFANVGAGQMGVFALGMSKANIAAAALGLTLGATVVVMNDMTKAAATIEQELRGISSVTKMGAADMGMLKTNFQNLSRDLPVTTTQLNDIARNAALMGVQGVNDITKFTGAIALLGVATRDNNKAFVDMGDLSEQIAIFLNETGSSVKTFGTDLQGVVNVLAAVDEVTPGTINSTLRLSKYMAAGAVTLGLTRAEIVALSGALSGLGANAEAGGSAVIRVLMKMSRAAGAPKEQFNALADSIGMSGDELTEMMGDNPAALGNAFAQAMGVTADEFERLVKTSPAEAFLKLADGLNKAHHEGKDMTEILDSLGLKNVRDIRLVDQLTVGNNLLARSINAAKNATADAGALQRRVAEATNNYNDKVTRLNNTFTVFKQNLGGPVLDTLTDIVDAMLQVSDEVMNSKASIDGFAKWKPGDSGVVFFFKTLYNTVKMLGDLFESVGEKLNKMNEGSMKNIEDMMHVYERFSILNALGTGGKIGGGGAAALLPGNIKAYEQDPEMYKKMYKDMISAEATARAQATSDPNSPFYNPLNNNIAGQNGAAVTLKKLDPSTVFAPPTVGTIVTEVVKDVMGAMGLGGRKVLNEFGVSGKDYKHDGAVSANATHRGVDVAAPRGTPIKAPFTGQIQYEQDGKNGKIFRLLDQFGNKLVGIHMDQFDTEVQKAIAEGGGKAFVVKGQKIGTVGNTGTTAGSYPHLHFEGMVAGSNAKSDPTKIPYGVGPGVANTPATAANITNSPADQLAKQNAYTKKEVDIAQGLYDAWRKAQKNRTAQGRIEEALAMKAINAFKTTHGAAWKVIVDTNKRMEAEQKKIDKENQKYADMAGVSTEVLNKYKGAALALARAQEIANKSTDSSVINQYANDYAKYAKQGEDAVKVFNAVSQAYQNTMGKNKENTSGVSDALFNKYKERALVLAKQQEVASNSTDPKVINAYKLALKEYEKLGDAAIDVFNSVSNAYQNSLSGVKDNTSGVSDAVYNKYKARALELAKLEEQASKSLSGEDINKYKRAYDEFAKSGDDAVKVFDSVSAAYKNSLNDKTDPNKVLREKLAQQADLTLAQYQTLQEQAENNVARQQGIRDVNLELAGDNLNKQYLQELSTNKKITDARIIALDAQTRVSMKQAKITRDQRRAAAAETYKNDPGGLAKANRAIEDQYVLETGAIEQKAADQRIAINAEMTGRLTKLEKQLGVERTEIIKQRHDQYNNLTVQQLAVQSKLNDADIAQQTAARDKSLGLAKDDTARQYKIEMATNDSISRARRTGVTLKLEAAKKSLDIAKNAALAEAALLYKNDPEGLKRRQATINETYSDEIIAVDREAANERFVINTDMATRLTDLEDTLGKERVDSLRKQYAQGQQLTKEFYDNQADIAEGAASALEAARDAALEEVGKDYDKQYEIELAFADRVDEARRNAIQARLIAGKRANEQAREAARVEAREAFKGNPEGLAQRYESIDKIFNQNNTLLYQQHFNDGLTISGDRMKRFGDLADDAMNAFNEGIEDSIENIESVSDRGLNFLIDKALKIKNAALLLAATNEKNRRDEDRTRTNTANRTEIFQQDADKAGRYVTDLQGELTQLLNIVGDNIDERMKLITEYGPKIYAAELAAAVAAQSAALQAEQVRYDEERKAAVKAGYDLEAIETKHNNNIEGINATFFAVSTTARDTYTNQLNEIIASGTQEQLATQMEYLSEMNGLERAALRASLNDQLVMYKARGDAGVASVHLIEAALKDLDKTDKDLSRTFLKGLSDSAKSVARSLESNLAGLMPEKDAASASEAGDRAVKGADDFIQGVQDDIDTLKQDFSGLENPTDLDKKAYGARLKLLEDYLGKAKSLSKEIRQQAEDDYNKNIAQLTRDNALEAQNIDLDFDRGMGNISEAQYRARKHELDLAAIQNTYDDELDIAGQNQDLQLLAYEKFNNARNKLNDEFLIDSKNTSLEINKEIQDDANQAKMDELEYKHEMQMISDKQYLEDRRKLLLDEAAMQLQFDLAQAGADPVKQADAHRKYLASVTAAERQASQARIANFKSEEEAIRGAASAIIGIIGDETLTKIYNAASDLYDSAMQIGKDITAVMLNPADVKSWASLIMNVFKAVDSIVKIIDELDPNFKAWKQAQLELVETQNKALSTIEKRAGKFYNGVFASPYAKSLQEDAIAREKRANAGFWQKVGWALFGGAPEVMADQAAETLSKLQSIFAGLADGITNAFEDSLYNAYLTGNWDMVGADMEKAMTQAIVKPIITTMLGAAVATGAMGADLQAITEAINEGRYEDLPGLVDKAVMDGSEVVRGLRPALERLPGAGSGAADVEDPFSGSGAQELFGTGPDAQFGAMPTDFVTGARDVRIGGERILQAAQILEGISMRAAGTSNAPAPTSTSQSGLGPIRL